MGSFREYSAKVMETYFEEFGGSELSVLLRDANAGKLRDASIFNLRQERFSGTDIHFLNHFLDQNNPLKKKILVSKEELINAIGDYGGFKKVEVFIKRYKKNPKSTTDDRNIEFLAWLIDFKPRPFDSFNKYEKEEQALEGILETKGLGLSEKESHLINHLLFDIELLEKLKEEILVKVLKKYNLEHNESFLRYRDEIQDTVAIQALTISKLETKVDKLQVQLKRARVVRRWTRGLGLFFVSVDYREPSVNNLFEDLLYEYQGLEDDDTWDDLI